MMETKYGDTTIRWEKGDSKIYVHSLVCNEEWEWEEHDEELSLFEFLSRLGVTATQVERAYAAEDEE